MNFIHISTTGIRTSMIDSGLLYMVGKVVETEKGP